MSETTLHKLVDLHRSGSVTEAIEGYLIQIGHCSEPKVLAQYHELLGIAYGQIGELEQSLLHFKTALTHAPNALSIQSNVATCYKKLNQPHKAAKVYQDILAHHPAQCIPMNNLANIYLSQGKTEIAVNLLQKAICVHPQYSDAYFNLGLAFAQTNKPSFLFFKTAMDLGHRQAPYQVAQHYEKQRSLEDAKQAYQLMIQHFPNHALGHHGLARTLLSLDEDEEAIGHFIQAQRIDPTIPHLMENIATYYHVKGMHANAIEYWSKTPKTDENIVDIHYNTAVAYQYLNRHEDALEYFQNVLSLEPNHTHTHMNIAAIALQNNQITAALQHYETAQRLDPKNADIDFIISALKKQTTKQKQAPKGYVANLFDQYAGHYDEHLVNMLRYQLPEKIELILYEQFKPNSDLSILDLGCGTGLMAPLLTPFAKTLIGVDLSQNMLAKADSRQQYTQLHQSDCLEYLQKNHTDPQQSTTEYELITAAELFPYIGDLSPLLLEAINSLSPNGIIIFSVETTIETEQFQLSQNARFQHNPNWITQLVIGHTQAEIVESTPVTLRLHQSKAVPGQLFVVKKTVSKTT